MRNITRKLGEHDDYNPYNLATHFSEEELRQEYNRLRRSLNRNVKKIIENGEFGTPEVVSSAKDFQSASHYNKQELAMKLSDLENVMSANTSTLTGLRENRRQILETLHDRGYTAINKSNFMEFTKFMEKTKSLALSILRYHYVRGVPEGEDKNKRLEMFSMAVNKGISINSLQKDFQFYLEHMDEIQQLPNRKTKKKLGTKSVRKMLEGLK